MTSNDGHDKQSMAMASKIDGHGKQIDSHCEEERRSNLIYKLFKKSNIEHFFILAKMT